MIRAIVTTIALASSTLGCATGAPTPYSIAGIQQGAAQAYMDDCLKLSFHQQHRYTPAIELWQACKQAAHGHTSMRQPADR